MRINDNEHISRIGLDHDTLQAKTDEDIYGHEMQKKKNSTMKWLPTQEMQCLNFKIDNV